MAYARAGHTSKAHKIIEELQAIATEAYVPSTFIALICSGLGEIDKALDWFERAIKERDAALIFHLPHPLP